MTAAPFSLAGALRGARDAIPIAVSVGIYGIAFGLVASQTGLGLEQALGMSAAVYSGSAQLAAMSLIGAGQATLGALAAAILVINARYILFGATLRPWLGAVPPRLAYPSLLLLGDGNWILTMNAAARGEADRAYLAGSGLPMIAGWLGGTALGATAGGVLPAPEALGADFMLPAFAAAMMAGMTKGRGDIGPIAAGAGAALAVAPFGGAGWATVAAGVAGAALAALLSGRRA